MRTLFLSALVGASISFASYTVQANQTWQGRGVVQSISDNAVMLRHEAIPELKWPAMTMPFTLSAGTTLKAPNRGMR
ncbi:copper-binding protein [Enterobacter hormaechei]|uniref:copper-binding protein n=1 Tax=Enterobacter hormaechei TaxID=158836 RepID=UPI00079C6C14|nr:copper-binding protein [Enterobacter hormaechei]CZY33369.1 putative copper efflux system periplasmic protein CusF [Enterobacter hormaechei]